MEVILREDIEKVGHRGEVVKVAPGYARNFLLPKKLAVLATDSNKKIVEQERDAYLRREAKAKNEAEDLGRMLAGVTVTITQRAGEEGHLFGSVTAKDIADALERQNYTIDRLRLRNRRSGVPVRFEPSSRNHHLLLVRISRVGVKLQRTLVAQSVLQHRLSARTGVVGGRQQRLGSPRTHGEPVGGETFPNRCAALAVILNSRLIRTGEQLPAPRLSLALFSKKLPGIDTGNRRAAQIILPNRNVPLVEVDIPPSGWLRVVQAQYRQRDGLRHGNPCCRLLNVRQGAEHSYSSVRGI